MKGEILYAHAEKAKVKVKSDPFFCRYLNDFDEFAEGSVVVGQVIESETQGELGCHHTFGVEQLHVEPWEGYNKEPESFRSVHKLKTLEPYFDAQMKGSKNFEYRIDDRDFRRGDFIELIEVKAAVNGDLEPTGRTLLKQITFVLDTLNGVKLSHNNEPMVILSTK